jgi:hypothetical protein
MFFEQVYWLGRELPYLVKGRALVNDLTLSGLNQDSNCLSCSLELKEHCAEALSGYRDCNFDPQIPVPNSRANKSFVMVLPT